MPVTGALEFYLIGAKGLSGADFIRKNHPYATLYYKGQNFKSTVDEEGGAAPVWNQKFNFQLVEDDPDDIIVNIYDEDKKNGDEFLGEAIVNIAKVCEDRDLPNTSFDVIRPSGHKHGTLQVSMKFMAKGDKPESNDYKKFFFGRTMDILKKKMKRGMQSMHVKRDDLHKPP